MKEIFKSKKFAIFVSYSLICINVLSNLFLTPIYLKYLGTDGYGFYQMIYSVAAYVLILDLGIGTTMVRFISFYREKKDKKGEEVFSFYCLILVLFMSILVLIVGNVINLNLTNIYTNLSSKEIILGHKIFKLMILTLFLTIWERFLEGISMSYEYFSITKIINLFKLIFKFIFVILLLIKNVGILSLVYSDILSIFISIAIYVYIDFKKMEFRIKYHKGYFKIIKSMATFMVAILLQSIIMYLNNTVDKTLLGMMIGKTATGIYSLAMTFVVAFNMFPTAISTLFLPQATKLVLKDSNRKELTDFVIKPGRFQFIVCGGILAGFILLGQDFIKLWAKENVFEIWIIALIIMIPNMVTLIENTIITILDAKNKRMFRSLILVLVSVINVILTIFLIKLIGAIGAPIATAISYIIGYIIIMNIYYDKVINIDIILMFREIFKGILLCILVSSFILILVQNINIKVNLFRVIMESIFFIVVYILLLYKYGLKKEEKEILNNIIRRIR